MRNVETTLRRRGVIAPDAVLAREGRSGTSGMLLGEDRLGRTFDALVASGQADHADLIAVAVERSHEYYGVPAILASGAAREWAHGLSDEAAAEIMYHEAPAAFERAQADAIVASAKQSLRVRVRKQGLRERVHGR